MNNCKHNFIYEAIEEGCYECQGGIGLDCVCLDCGKKTYIGPTYFEENQRSMLNKHQETLKKLHEVYKEIDKAKYGQPL